MTHEFPITIYYSHTDAGGVVYHANYLTFCEHARADFFATVGFSLPDLMKRNLGFTVKHCTLNLQTPLAFADVVIVHTTVKEIGTTKIIFSHRLINRDKHLVVAEVECVTVAINQAYEKQPIPDELKEKLAMYS